MKEFNLEEFKKDPSRKVITRDGRDVRIICTDYKREQPIIALVTTNTKEDVHFFYKNGRWSNTNEWDLDLFFATTKKEGWVNLYKDKDEDITYLPGIIYDSEEDAKEAIKDDPEFIATIKIEWEE